MTGTNVQTVPFARQFGPGDSGVDCRAVKRSLAVYGKSSAGMSLRTNTFAKAAQDALSAFKQHHKLLDDPIYTREAHDALRPFFDQFGASLMVEEARIVSAEQQRAAYTHALQWFIDHHGQVRYDQVRPIPEYLNAFETTEDIYTDCSGMVTLAAKWAGLPDPNGLAFNGEGNTGSLFDHCAKVSQRQALPADLAWFGRPGDTYGEHVIGIVSKLPGGDFACASNGYPGDPISHTFSSVRNELASGGYTWVQFLRWLPIP